MNTAEILGMESVRLVPRALGFVDREAKSAAFGCADRYFWHYKLHDFPNARFQETAELLALAYTWRHAENPFHGKDRVRAWALGCVRFWERIMRSDGSFDEAYPFERSFCATSFSTLHALSALVVLSERPSADIRRVGRWLAAHDGPDTANQRAASAAALALIAAFEGDDGFRNAARKRVEALRDEHARLGYFNEYGGRDAGYTTITLSALAAYSDHAKDSESAAWVRSEAKNIGDLLRDDGRYDITGQSRATQFFYPYALAWARNGALAKIVRGVAEDRILKPSWMDDRYMVAYATDYLRCALRS